MKNDCSSMGSVGRSKIWDLVIYTLYERGSWSWKGSSPAHVLKTLFEGCSHMLNSWPIILHRWEILSYTIFSCPFVIYRRVPMMQDWVSRVIQRQGHVARSVVCMTNKSSRRRYASSFEHTSVKMESTYTGGFNIFNQGRRILVTGGTGQIGTSYTCVSSAASRSSV
jgi:hypothetical protein